VLVPLFTVDYIQQTNEANTLIPDSLKQIDFLVQATGDIYNPTGIITPITEAAFEYVHESPTPTVTVSPVKTLNNTLRSSRIISTSFFITPTMA